MVRRFATWCGVQLCGGASIPRLVCVSWPFRAFVSVMCLSAFASIKEIRVQVMFRLGGIAMCVIPAMSTGVTVLPVLGCASVAPRSQVFPRSPRPVIRLANLSFVSQLPVTGRASEGKVTPAMFSRGHAVIKETRVPGVCVHVGVSLAQLACPLVPGGSVRGVVPATGMCVVILSGKSLLVTGRASEGMSRTAPGGAPRAGSSLLVSHFRVTGRALVGIV